MKNFAIGLITIFFLFEAAQSSKKDEWRDFDYKHAGITSSEFEMVIEKGMSKKKLLKLLEYGIMPAEYFSEPWLKLGVSESEWLDAKKQGLEDMDIDRRVYTRSYFNYDPLVSFFAPGFYAYKTKRHKIGGAMTGAFLIGVVLTFVHKDETATGTDTPPQKTIRLIYPIIALCSMVWSSGDAYIATRYSDNVDAGRFSLNVIPSKFPSVRLSINF